MDKLKPPRGLRQSIIFGIGQVERSRARVYLFISTSILPLSIIGVIFSGKYLLQSFYQSGFYDYFSLLFSGDGAVFTYWKELTYSLAETIPILGTIAFLTALGFFIWSGANAVSNVRRFALST